MAEPLWAVPFVNVQLEIEKFKLSNIDKNP
jgi:hypothetical protein